MLPGHTCWTQLRAMLAVEPCADACLLDACGAFRMVLAAELDDALEKLGQSDFLLKVHPHPDDF